MIRVDSLRVQYGDFTAVDDISFSVAKQEIFGIIGPNGAGKTSAVECIIGLRNCSGGDVSVLGLDPWKERKKLHRSIGVQLQHTVYQDNAKVQEICRLFSALYDKPQDYHDLLETMDLTNKKDVYVSKLSGGQRQKLSIVLALIPNPQVVFLDELTTGLDPHARHQMWDLLLKLRDEGLTIVIVSHFMDEVEAICDRVAVMDGGRIISQGPIAEVSSKFNLGNKISFMAADFDETTIEQFEQVISVQRKGPMVTVLVKGDETVNEVMQYLQANAIAHSSLSVSRPSLEDVFLKLVDNSMAQGQ